MTRVKRSRGIPLARRSLKSADVAQAAGVSRATVSYVLNDRRDVRVSDTTRKHVLEVARRLGYIGSPAARALRSGRGDVVLLLVPDWDVSGQLAVLLEDIGSLVAQYGLVCLRYEGSLWQGSLDRILGRIPAACVVTLSPLGDNDAQALDSAAIPEVPAWLPDQPGHPHTTALHQADIVQAQVDHLLQQGYHRLAYLAHEEPRALPFTEPRITAFQDICRIHGILDAPYAIVSLDLDTIRHTLQTWTAQAGEPLGVVAWNDVTALGIISAATAMGINVPNDLGVMGGDDTPVATLTRPTISSVRFDLPAEAQVIANHIAGAIGSSTDPAAGKTAAVIVVPRQSTARTRLGWDRRNGVTDLANTPS